MKDTNASVYEPCIDMVVVAKGLTSGNAPSVTGMYRLCYIKIYPSRFYSTRG